MSISQQRPNTKTLRDSRITATAYLVMAIAGMFGFVALHPQIFDPISAQKTIINIQTHPQIAYTRLIFEYLIILSQAVTALYFFKLFKNVNAWAATSIALLGMVNCIAVMISAIAIRSSIHLVLSPQIFPGEIAPSIHLLQSISESAWDIGGLFFGLWLIPMGYIIVQSGNMPVWLGRTLIFGGIGYIAAVLGKQIAPDFAYWDILVAPATVGEFWIIGYLFIFGL